VIYLTSAFKPNPKHLQPRTTTISRQCSHAPLSQVPAALCWIDKLLVSTCMSRDAVLEICNVSLPI